MIAMVQADLLKLQRRRGLWGCVLLLCPALVALIFMLVATEVAELDGGASFINDMGTAMSIVGTILVVVVGARLGSEERAEGTLRYQRLTGLAAGPLLLSKLLVLLITALVIAALATLAATLGALGLGGESVEPIDVADAFWEVLLNALVYGCLAFGIGAMVGSTGPAIATALVFNLLGTNLLFVLTLIDESLKYIVVSIGVDRLTSRGLSGDDTMELFPAILVTLAWPAAFLGAAWARLRKLEV